MKIERFFVESVPNLLRSKRYEYGFTQSELAEKTGLDTTTISGHEQGGKLRLSSVKCYMAVYYPDNPDNYALLFRSHESGQKDVGIVAEMEDEVEIGMNNQRVIEKLLEVIVYFNEIYFQLPQSIKNGLKSIGIYFPENWHIIHNGLPKNLSCWLNRTSRYAEAGNLYKKRRDTFISNLEYIMFAIYLMKFPQYKYSKKKVGGDICSDQVVEAYLKNLKKDYFVALPETKDSKFLDTANKFNNFYLKEATNEEKVYFEDIYLGINKIDIYKLNDEEYKNYLLNLISCVAKKWNLVRNIKVTYVFINGICGCFDNQCTFITKIDELEFILKVLNYFLLNIKELYIVEWSEKDIDDANKALELLDGKYMYIC